MKTTLRLSTFIVALVSVFTFSSCLNDSNDSSSSANYYSTVTITGDDVFGYTFYADFGSPVSSLAECILPAIISALK